MARKITKADAAAAAKVLGQAVAPETPVKAARKIVGIPTEEQKTKARTKAAAKPKGGKPGSAQANQSAQYAEGTLDISTGGERAPKTAAKPSSDKIAKVQGTTSGAEYIVVSAGVGGAVVSVPRSRFIGELTKLAVVGGSMRAVEAYIRDHKPEAKLATGLSGKDAPQSAMAAAASRKGAKAPEAKAAEAAGQKERRVTTQKEAKPAGKLDLTAKLVEVAANPKKAGTSTFTRYAAAYKVGRTLAEVLKHTTRADIDWDLKRGFIKVG